MSSPARSAAACPPHFNALRMLLLSASLLAAGSLPASLAHAEAAPEPGAASKSAPLTAINVSEVRARPLTDRVIATGLISPVEEVLVQPLIEGQPIESLAADVGDEVTEGQVLAVLSRSSLDLQRAQNLATEAAAKASIAQAEAQMIEAEAANAEAQRVAERTRKLKEQGSATQAAYDSASSSATASAARVAVTRQALESAKAQLALAEAQLANTDLMLTRTEVRAPYAGRITARNATIGAIATAAAAPMFVMEKEGRLELRADISESDLLRVAVGQPVQLRAVGIAAPISGTVRLVEPAIDTASRLGRARISVAEGAALRSGMFVEAEIILDAREALALPVTALGLEEGQTAVTRIKDGVAERVPVTAGIRDGAWVEIREGLSAGDLVVTKAGSFVRAGDLVNPIPDTTGTATN